MGEQPPFPTPQLLTHLLRALLRAGAAHLPLNPAWRWARRTPAEMGVTQVIAPIWCPSSLGPSPRAWALVSAVEAAGGSARLLVSWLPAPSCCSLPPGMGGLWQMGLGHAVPCVRGCSPASWGCRGLGDVEKQGKAQLLVQKPAQLSVLSSGRRRRLPADPIPGRIWVLRYQQSQSALGSQIPLWIWPKELKTVAGNFPDGSQRLRRRPQAWLRSRSEG